MVNTSQNFYRKLVRAQVLYSWPRLRTKFPSPRVCAIIQVNYVQITDLCAVTAVLYRFMIYKSILDRDHFCAHLLSKYSGIFLRIFYLCMKWLNTLEAAVFSLHVAFVFSLLKASRFVFLQRTKLCFSPTTGRSSKLQWSMFSNVRLPCRWNCRPPTSRKCEFLKPNSKPSTSMTGVKLKVRAVSFLWRRERERSYRCLAEW